MGHDRRRSQPSQTVVLLLVIGGHEAGEQLDRAEADRLGASSVPGSPPSGALSANAGAKRSARAIIPSGPRGSRDDRTPQTRRRAIVGRLLYGALHQNERECGPVRHRHRRRRRGRSSVVARRRTRKVISPMACRLVNRCAAPFPAIRVMAARTATTGTDRDRNVRPSCRPPRMRARRPSAAFCGVGAAAALGGWDTSMPTESRPSSWRCLFAALRAPSAALVRGPRPV